jgi:anti-sigma factor RsiW
MVCEAWKAKIDTYLDGELPDEDMRTFDAHVRNCPSCAADALSRVQMKRAVQHQVPISEAGCSKVSRPNLDGAASAGRG